MDKQEHNGASGAIERARFPFAIETASESDDGRLRIRGVANTFGVMRSGRIIHPAAVETWLKANPDARPQLLVNHGMDVGGLATIGKVESLTVDRKRGLIFSAWLASGTRMADEARTLVQQRAIDSVSLGWCASQARYVKATDRDLDPWLAEKMREAGCTEARAFLGISDIPELSLVDVPDDAGAKVAARADAATIEALQRDIAGLREDLDGLKRGGGAGLDIAALQETFEGFLEQFESAAIEALQSDELIREAAGALLGDIAEVAAGSDDDAGDDTDSDADDGDAVASVRAKLDKWGKGDGK